jgi:hypothetical protein
LLTALGYRNTVALAAAIRVLKQFTYLLANGTFPVDRSGLTPTPMEARRTVTEHPSLVDWIHVARNIRSAGIPGGDGLWAGILYWCSLIDDEAAEDARVFAERLQEGTELSDGDPVLALRNKLLSIRAPIRRRYAYDDLTALIVKAWNAYRKGEQIFLLHWRRGGARPERFPIPE